MLSIIYDDISDIKKLEKSVRSFLNNVYDKSDIQFIFITEKYFLELKQLQIDCKFKIVNDTIENVVKNIDGDWFWNVSENFIILTKNFDRIFDLHMETLHDKNNITFEHFGVTTNLSRICCKHESKPCFVIRNKVHANLAQNIKYNSFKYDENIFVL